MSRWFRFYTKATRNPKVLALSDKDFRLWVNLLCIASENDGQLPDDEGLKLVLRMRLDHLSSALKRLIKGGLIDRLDDGYTPHDWDEYQYKSDTSTERVKRHRERVKRSSNALDTETDTETEKEQEEGADAPYTFVGKVIRLKAADYDQWRRAYANLDLRAELQSRDDWLATQPGDRRKNWFVPTSNYLANRNREAKAEAQRAAANGYPPGHSGVPL